MPHLSIDYSGNLDDAVDMAAFCETMRQAMIATGIFPMGGVRVRALRVDAWAIGDGAPDHAYLHMTCRVGAGRDEDTRLAAAEALYAAAEAHLRPLIRRPFALSLDLDELHPVTSLKRWNSVHEAVRASS